MQIVCPSCKTSYQIADVAVGASGRSVRCSRCQTVWHITPPTAQPAAAAPAEEASMAAFRAELGGAEPAAPAAEAAAEPSDDLDDLVVSTMPEPAKSAAAGGSDDAAPVALSEIPIPVEPPLAADSGGVARASGADIDISRPDIESVAARRARTATRKRRSRTRLPLAAAIAALMLVSAGLVSFRKDVVRHVPQLASFYSALGMPVNLRGMAFADLKIGNEIHDGVPVLVIEGMIVSTTSKTVDVPRLRFALRSATGAEVYSWTAPPAQPTLSAYETLPFRSRLASPPAEGHDVQVRFFTRRDAVASLH